jgi:hypothetical protein
MIDPVTGSQHEIDECELMPGTCQHGTCMNTIGSFRCECERGYEFDEDSHQCIDKAGHEARNGEKNYMAKMSF